MVQPMSGESAVRSIGRGWLRYRYVAISICSFSSAIPILLRAPPHGQTFHYTQIPSLVPKRNGDTKQRWPMPITRVLLARDISTSL